MEKRLQLPTKKKLRQRMEYKWLDKSGYSEEKIKSLVAKGVVDPCVASLVVADRKTNADKKTGRLAAAGINIKTKSPSKSTLKEKIYNYLDEHPGAATSETRKAVGCKLSTAKKYRGQWLISEKEKIANDVIK